MSADAKEGGAEFEVEVILTEMQIMRQRLVSDKAAMMEVEIVMFFIN